MFRTVRAKLMALVALSALAPLATMPLLHWLMRDALLREVDDRVEDASKAFLLELNDDLTDLTLAARMRALDPETRTALLKRDANALHLAAKQFHTVYPDFDVLFYDVDGKLITSLGCSNPPATTTGQPFTQFDAAHEFHGLVPHGCETATDPRHAPPLAWTVAIQVPGAGMVVVCLPLDDDFTRNVAQKLGISLCVSDAQNRVTGEFAVGQISACAVHSALETVVMEGDVARFHFAPPQLPGVHVGSAMNVAGVQKALDRHLQVATFIIALAALLAIVLGARIAGRMSVALKRVTEAHRKLQNQQYVKVPFMKTGDEIEDLATGFNTMVDGLQERDRLQATMGKYLSEQVVEHLMAGRVELGGVTLPVTILFSDIRSFTSISETMSAHELVALLNEYFTDMLRIVMQEGGVVDKYIGDAIMAVFGAPVPKPDDAERAVRAAVRMREALVTLNVRLAARGLTQLRTGIGIHTGEVVAGNIGSDQRMEYTVIGDAVNLASRLESATKELNADLLISEETHRLVAAHFNTKQIREITVKGRQQPVMVYEVLSERRDG